MASDSSSNSSINLMQPCDIPTRSKTRLHFSRSTIEKCGHQSSTACFLPEDGASQSQTKRSKRDPLNGIVLCQQELSQTKKKLKEVKRKVAFLEGQKAALESINAQQVRQIAQQAEEIGRLRSGLDIELPPRMAGTPRSDIMKAKPNGGTVDIENIEGLQSRPPAETSSGSRASPPVPGTVPAHDAASPPQLVLPARPEPSDCSTNVGCVSPSGKLDELRLTDPCEWLRLLVRQISVASHDNSNCVACAKVLADCIHNKKQPLPIERRMEEFTISFYHNPAHLALGVTGLFVADRAFLAQFYPSLPLWRARCIKMEEDGAATGGFVSVTQHWKGVECRKCATSQLTSQLSALPGIGPRNESYGFLFYVSQLTPEDPEATFHMANYFRSGGTLFYVDAQQGTVSPEPSYVDTEGLPYQGQAFYLPLSSVPDEGTA